VGLSLEEAERLGIAEHHPDHPGRRADAPGRLPVGPPSRWTVVVPGWHPARVNQLITARHWSIAHRLKSRDKLKVYAAMLSQKVTAAAGKRQVGLTIILGPRQRGGDVDSYWKSCLDACVSCGALTDDTHRGVELTPVRYERGEGPSTVITIADAGYV
jgi:Holliday junction resolvase RusA-like endonuclease